LKKDSFVRAFFDLTKFGIVCFVLFTGTSAYFLGQQVDQKLNLLHFFTFIMALYFLSSGSFALNQLQEIDIDQKMPRTKGRPLPAGIFSKKTVAILSIVFLALGLALGSFVSSWFVLYGFLTVIMYNGLYTMYWKKRWAFGAVPGAIPGAMPILIGYGAHNIALSIESFYLFVLMFLWQMPHFWALALRYREDYAIGGIPVLPVVIGESRTLYHIGLYVFAYAAWAVASPWFISVWIGYLLVILPFVAKVVVEFLSYYKEPTSKKWLPFFLWTTFSVLVFVIIPVFDKWGEMVFERL
jgi:protoheme IX farnesyltransferase